MSGGIPLHGVPGVIPSLALETVHDVRHIWVIHCLFRSTRSELSGLSVT